METETLHHKLSEQGYKEFNLTDQLDPGKSVIKLLKDGAKEVKSYRYRDLEPNGKKHNPNYIILFYK